MSNNNKDDKRPAADDSSVENILSSSESATVKPRRSARLLGKVEAAADKGDGSDSGTVRSKSPLKRVNEEEQESTRNSRQKMTETAGTTENASSNDVTVADITGSDNISVTSIPTLPSATTQIPPPPLAPQNIRPSLSSSPPIFSISIGFGPMPPSFATLSSSSPLAAHFMSSGNQHDLPPEIQQMIENMTEGMQNGASGRSATTFRSVGDGIGIGITGISIPISVMNANVNLGANNNDFLELARQMSQIISRGRLSSPTSEDFATISEDLEPLLNDFFSRIFGGMPSSAPAGLSTERIGQLPETSDKSEIDCSICREIGRVEEEKCVELPCKHSFHFECIEPWLKRVSSCPICRKVIE